MLSEMVRPRNLDLTEAHRRLSNLMRLGTLEEIDYGQAIGRVRFGGILTDWLPFIVARAGQDRQFWAPDLGEQVVVLSPSGDLVQGVILGSIYRTRYPVTRAGEGRNTAIFGDGTMVQYDRRAHTLTIEMQEGGIKIVAPRGIDITGDVRVIGCVLDTC